MLQEPKPLVVVLLVESPNSLWPAFWNLSSIHYQFLLPLSFLVLNKVLHSLLDDIWAKKSLRMIGVVLTMIPLFMLLFDAYLSEWEINNHCQANLKMSFAQTNKGGSFSFIMSFKKKIQKSLLATQSANECSRAMLRAIKY